MDSLVDLLPPDVAPEPLSPISDCSWPLTPFCAGAAAVPTPPVSSNCAEWLVAVDTELDVVLLRNSPNGSSCGGATAGVSVNMNIIITHLMRSRRSKG